MHKNKRCPFSEKENQLIIDSVKLFGEDWERIARKLPNRTPKQCHDRYNNYLRDGLKKEPWTEQEDKILIRLFNEIGPKWTKMMIEIPGRSGNDIKNRWHKHLNKFTSNSVHLQSQISNSFVNQYNYQLYPVAYNCQYNTQIYTPNVYPMLQVNPQMISQGQNLNNYMNIVNQSISNIPKSKKCGPFIKKKRKDPKINEKSNNEIENGKVISQVNKIQKLDDGKSMDFSKSNTTKEKFDVFSSVNLSDIDIQEFFDGLNIANIDFFTLM